MKLKQLFHVKNVFNNVNMFKWTLQLLSGYTFYIVHDCKFDMSKLINKKSQKDLCLKWTYRLFGNDYRVVLIFKRYPTAKGIIPESLNSIGQF